MDCDRRENSDVPGTAIRATDMSRAVSHPSRLPPPIPQPQLRQQAPGVTVDPVSFREIDRSPVLPLPEPMTLGALREAIARTVKGVLIIAGVLTIEGVAFSFVKSSGNYRFTIWDWIALAIALFVAGLGSTLYRPVSGIVSHYLTTGVRSGKAPAWCGQYLANLTAALKKTLFLLLVGLFYVILMPTVSRFNGLVLKTEMVTTVLNVVIIIGSLVILFLIGKGLYPLLDHFTQHVTDRVAPIPMPDSHHQTAPIPDVTSSASESFCPNCKVQNDSKALFCSSCGSSLASQPKIQPPRSDKKICSGCYAQNDCSSKFCFNCGASL